MCIWCNRICWHALIFKKYIIFQILYTLLYVLYAPPLSNFLKSPLFRQAQSALIGQLTQSNVIGRTPQAALEMYVGNARSHTHTHTHTAALWPWLYPKSHPLPSNSALWLFEGAAILSGVRTHSGCSRVHSFNPTMHRKNDVHSTARIPITHSLPEDGARSWIIHSFILEALIHSVIQSNQPRYKLIVNWLLRFVHNFRDRVQDKSFNWSFPSQMIIKQQANYAKAAVLSGALSVRIHSLDFTHSFKWTV